MQRANRPTTISWLSLVALGLVVLSLPAFGSKFASAAGQKLDRSGGVYIPKGIPAELWRKTIPKDNQLTRDKIALGQSLFFDKRLSADGSVSCATCHDPANAYADSHPRTIGVAGKEGTRNAPTILNATFNTSLFWDGRVKTLEEQLLRPLLNPSEMGMQNMEAVVDRVALDPDYRQRFRRVFKGAGITIETIARAIAAYERTQLSGNSPFDRFISGDTTAITEAQKRGWELFQNKAQCITCHTFTPASPFFTDFSFHNTGAGIEVASVSEPGRFLVTGLEKDLGAFKTPSLRDCELTTPYMHDGSQKTLLDVVRFYNRGGRRNPALDERMRPLNLTEGEISDVVEFLRALTSDDVLRETQVRQPQTRTAR